LHRSLSTDIEMAQAIAALDLAQQDAVPDQTTTHNRRRFHLRKYYPAS
jgi:hypothetical protein